MPPEVDPKIAHLSPDDIELLVACYYDKTNKVVDILEQFEIDVHPTQLRKLLPPSITDEHCPYCSGALYKERPARTEPSSLDCDLFCDKCGHREFAEYYSWKTCNCAACTERRRIEAKEEARLRQSHEEVVRSRAHYSFGHDRPSTPYTIYDFQITEAVYLLALMRASRAESLLALGTFSPNGIQDNITTSTDQTSLLLRELRDAGVIGVAAYQSPIEAFDLGDDDTLSYYIFKVHYETTFAPDEDTAAELLKEIEQAFRTKNWPHHWRFDGAEDLYDLWKKFALEESLQYLRYYLEERKLPYNPGPKTLQVLESALENFSTSQVVKMIWAAAKGAVDFMQRKGVSAKHAANTVPGAIQRYADRVLAEGWDYKGFERNYNMPRSMVVEILHDLALQLGSKGWSTSPNLESVSNQPLIDASE
ncbi:hypothetical protein [uncultured Pseudodesulfovibrio sp.]|uniref:hypothetical protein n=1 Tax=uncultured Pseudodesulfovibrio sp. TaxID=2035858 RepID=UPI0029C74636|nr:hypothetical protein [uncultured Pseudodesulfovibrio sp.]